MPLYFTQGDEGEPYANFSGEGQLFTVVATGSGFCVSPDGWIVTNARGRSEKTMQDRLVGELLDSTSGRGGAIKKKDDVHRMAEANKAFAHYRF